MHRRTLIKASSTAILSGLSGIPEALASCQASYGLPSSILGTSIEEPIEALFDREYGEKHWQFSADMALRVTHPDNTEDERTVPFNVRLDALPPGMARCIQVEIYRRKIVRITSRTDSNLRMANYRVASCYPANVLPMEYRTRYRDSRGSGKLYVALSFLTLTGLTRVLVYSHPLEVKAYGGCSGAVYIQPDAEKQQAEVAIKVSSKTTVKTHFRNMQDHLIFKMLMRHDMQTGFQRDKQGLVIPADYVTQLKILIRGKVVARCELGPSISHNPFIYLTLPLYPEGTDVRIAYEDIRGKHHFFDTVVEYWVPKPPIISPE